jgi:hypothetical protein
MQGVAQFPQKIYEFSAHLSYAYCLLLLTLLIISPRMVNDPANEGLIRWSETGDSFFGTLPALLFRKHLH